MSVEQEAKGNYERFGKKLMSPIKKVTETHPGEEKVVGLAELSYRAGMS